MQTVIVILAALLGILALLLASGAVYQSVGTGRDRRLFPPPGRLVRVNNRLMHIHPTGEGTPTVLFESGMGASCLSWTLVQPAVAEFSRAVSYDRAGHGWSDPAHEPRTAYQIAQELRALMDVAGLPGPYVLVAHSSAATSAERSQTCIETKLLAWCWWTRFTLPNGKIRRRSR